MRRSSTLLLSIGNSIEFTWNMSQQLVLLLFLLLFLLFLNDSTKQQCNSFNHHAVLSHHHWIIISQQQQQPSSLFLAFQNSKTARNVFSYHYNSLSQKNSQLFVQQQRNSPSSNQVEEERDIKLNHHRDSTTCLSSPIKIHDDYETIISSKIAERSYPYLKKENNNNIIEEGKTRRKFVSQSLFMSFVTGMTSCVILPIKNAIAANDAVAVVVVENNNNNNKPREFATSAGRTNCTTISDPSKTVVTCYGDISNDEIHVSSISSTENGISTSAIRNPIRYSSPWTYITETSNATKAWISLYNTVLQMDSNIKIIKYTDTYLHVTVPTNSNNNILLQDTQDDDLDDVEFVLRPDDNLVLYRSASRKSVFVYPITQPISDRNSHKDRLQRIRNHLGWEEYT